jgi:Cd2+/Zn2+-exporting ATPase
MRMQFNLEGLCCPVCAAAIEKRDRKLKSVGAAALDYNTQRLSLELVERAGPGKGDPLERIAGEVRRIVADVEPAITVHQIGGSSAQTGEMGASRWKFYRIVLGAILFGAGFFLSPFPVLKLSLTTLSFLFIGADVLLRALRNILRGQVFDENFLMTIASIGAFAIGEYDEGVAVMLFYQIGEAVQDRAVNRSRRSIAALLDIRPTTAALQTPEGIREVAPEAVHPGDRILVRSGERIPLDGVVLEGRSSLDTSALTGEALPREVEPGSVVLSGSINSGGGGSGLLTVEVTREAGESTVSRILDLVQNAGSKKAPVENFITRFARYYTPAVVLTALVLAILPPLLIPGALFSDWLHRALVFLVVSCPCALVISIPLSFFGGIGAASRQGILVKGSNYLDALNQAETFVFDKTGTLTKGVFALSKTLPAESNTAADLLYYAACAEGSSNHPIARSILAAYAQPLDPLIVSSQEEIAGQGIRALLRDGTAVLAGSRRLLTAEGVPLPEEGGLSPVGGAGGTSVYVAVNGNYAGCLLIADEVKEDARRTIASLKALGVKKTVMLTGDNRAAGEWAAAQLGLDEVRSELLPQDKVAALETLAGRGKLVFVGDGINDAPVLARSDIGIAMGGAGQDAAIEAADIVLMTDEPSKLLTALKIARKTHRIVWQNIIFALGIKAVILVLGALGMAGMWLAVFGDVGVALLAVLNAMRPHRHGSAQT